MARNPLHLQPPMPKRFRVPTLVQPMWKPRDLLHALDSNATLSKLENLICRQYGVKYCLLLDRARTGLYLVAQGLNLHGEWLLTSFMHRPSAVMMHHQASALAFADINEDFAMDPQSAAGLVGPSTEVMLVTHMYGKAADIRTLRALADKNHIFLIENAVHIPGGTSVAGKPLGSWGDAAILSFNVDKPLGGILGGALLTNRDDVWQAVHRIKLADSPIAETWNRIYTTYLAYRLKPLIMRLPLAGRYAAPKDGVEEIESFPLASYARYTPQRIHPLQAAIALNAMQRSLDYTRTRIENARELMQLMPRSEELILPSETADCPHSFLYFPVLFTRRDRFEAAIRYAECGIETKWRYYPLHMQQDFSSYRHQGLEQTERCWRQHLLLPIGANMSSQEILYLAECTRNIM